MNGAREGQGKGAGMKLQGLADQIGNCLGRAKPLQRSIARPLHGSRRGIAIGDRTYRLCRFGKHQFIFSELEMFWQGHCEDKATPF